MKLSGPAETKKRARELRAKMSLPEVILWQALRRKQTGLHFRKQHPAGPYVLDFYCHAAKLCVEVDGEGHSWSLERDRARDRWLAAQGVKTIRVLARDVLNDLEAVVAYIVAQAPLRRASHATSPGGGGFEYAIFAHRGGVSPKD